MDDRERIDRLEVQLARLESEIRLLKRALGGRVPAAAPPAAPAAAPAAAPPSPPPTSRLARWRARAAPDLEAWLGENALLVVGVLALVAAVGFALKYAFDQGWISPAVRVGAGLLLGLGVALYGDRLQRRGLRRFGAAAVGAGAAIAYLALWAAAGPYRFVPTGVGIAALAVLSALVLASAWRSDEPYLAALAAFGAFQAPFLLGQEPASADLLLGYVALVAVAAGAVAVARRWKLTLWIALAGFVLTPAVTLADADALWTAIYLTAGGAAAIAATRSLGWERHAFVVWAAVWFELFFGADLAAAGWRGWAYVVLPVLLVAPGWLRAWRGGSAPASGRPLSEAPAREGLRLTSPTPLLLASAAAWALVAHLGLPPPADAYTLAVLGAIALVYIGPGLARRIPAFLTAGAAVLAIGVWGQWEGTAITLGWAVLVVLVGIAARHAPLAAVRWSAVALGALAALRLLTVDLPARPETDPAFRSAWSLALLGVTLALGLLAGPLWTKVDRRFTTWEGVNLHLVTWVLAGAVLFYGGTTEIQLAFAGRIDGRIDMDSLRGQLAVSAFWLLYAGGLLAYGFRAERKAVRVAGLVVAAIALLKVVIYDLSNLEALYRVASFALLAAITLLGGYAYHRRAVRSAGVSAEVGGHATASDDPPSTAEEGLDTG